MAKRGITTSRKDANDERRRLLELTDKGRAMLPRLHQIWADIESGVRDAVDYGGVDILAALEGIEQALAVQSLSERVSAHRSTRLMGEVEILDYASDSPDHREHFKAAQPRMA